MQHQGWHFCMIQILSEDCCDVSLPRARQNGFSVAPQTTKASAWSRQVFKWRLASSNRPVGVHSIPQQFGRRKATLATLLALLLCLSVGLCFQLSKSWSGNIQSASERHHSTVLKPSFTLPSVLSWRWQKSILFPITELKHVKIIKAQRNCDACASSTSAVARSCRASRLHPGRRLCDWREGNVIQCDPMRMESDDSECQGPARTF